MATAQAPAPVYVIHGTSTKDDDWFPWLEQAAAHCDPAMTVTRLDLPDPFAPRPQAWQQAIDRQIPVTDSSAPLVIVAHSLGCAASLRWIESHPELKNVRLILVGPFDQPLAGYPMLDAFVTPPFDYAHIRASLRACDVITAKDDPIAPSRVSQNMADSLHAQLVVRSHGGHFLSSDGYDRFPLVLKEVQRLSSIELCSY
jgi:predicted alpha/beta hydrolase family esterase